MKFIKRDPNLGYIDTHLWVPKGAINVEGAKDTLTYLLDNDRGATRCVQLYQETDDHLIVPRAFWTLDKLGITAVDCRPTTYPHINVKSRIVLDVKNPTKTTQRDAVDAILKSNGGILQLACGKGKTVCALQALTLRGYPALIVVPNDELFQQWLKEIHLHLDVPGGVGVIRAEKCDWKKDIVISTYQTLAARADELPSEVRQWFGTTIYDEGHHSAAPWFCRTIDLTYGLRLLLSATPNRKDGAHLIYNAHVGGVIYKDLTPDLTPSVQFLWTGLSLDMDNPKVCSAVNDCTGETHFKKLAGYLGTLPERLRFVLDVVHAKRLQGKKILVLSNSTATIINLYSLLHDAQAPLFSDMEADESLQEEVKAKPLHTVARARFELELKKCELALMSKDTSREERERIKTKIMPHIKKKLQADDVAKAVKKDLAHKQKAFVTSLVKQHTTAGLLTARVPPKQRKRMLKDYKVTFAIYQYGLEGLDDANLDCVIACEPLPGKNDLQQFMGRALRKSSNASKQPEVLFIEDEIDIITGMCSSIRRTLINWPPDEGGPYSFEYVGHPPERRRQRTCRI